MSAREFLWCSRPGCMHAGRVHHKTPVSLVVGWNHKGSGKSWARPLLASLVLAVLGWTPSASAQTLIAVDDVFSVPYGEDLVAEAPGVLDNDTYNGEPAVEGGATAELLADVSHGFLSCEAEPAFFLCPDGSFTYTPDTSFSGTDTFTYEAVVGGQTSQATVTLTACSGGPTVFICWQEAPYLAKLGQLSYSTFQEGFENDTTWGGVREPLTAPSVISQGIKWETNHPAPPAENEITTGTGPARTGQWGVYDPEHGYAAGLSGDCDVNNPAPECLFKDGFTGTRQPGESTLYGVGGYFNGTAGPNLVMILDGGTPIGFGLVAVGDGQFFGVIDTAGFATFRVEETDGKIGQKRLVFGDDFTFGTTPADTTPPTVTRVDSVEGTGDGALVDGEVTSAAITELYVRFSELVQDLGEMDPDDVTNPANHLLFDDGGNGFDTPDCIGGVATGDNSITVDWVSYLSGSQLEATLFVNGGVSLPSGEYRLLVCGSTSIRDWAGNPLDGDGNGTGGDDFRLDFTVFVNQAPVADDQVVSGPEDTAKPITLTANDPDSGPDPLTYHIVSNPTHGTLTGAPPSVTYDPDVNYVGPDSFTFRAFDGLDNSNTATVSITVTPVNDPPVANPDGYVVGLGGTLTVPAPGVLVNDNDVDGDGLTSQLEPMTGPNHAASFSFSSDGSFSYTHDGSANLTDSFGYRASDGALSSAPATVTITVNPGPITWYVATTGDDLDDCLSAVTPCRTVQEAVARAAGGDTIVVAAGIYAVNSLTVDKNLTIVGAGNTTVLDGGGAGLAVGAAPGVVLSFRLLAFADTAGG